MNLSVDVHGFRLQSPVATSQRLHFLKSVLAITLDRSADSISLIRDKNRKPQLAGESYPPFSYSHSGLFAAIALSPGPEIGLDIQTPRPWTEVQNTKTLFHAEEQEWLNSLAPEDQSFAFTQLWTRKEALAKLTGEGLSRQLLATKVLNETSSSVAFADFRLFNEIPGSVACFQADPVARLHLHEPLLGF